MSEWRFTIPGKPLPKARPRCGAGGVWYTPRETTGYEEKVALYALSGRADSGRFSGPVSVSLTFLLKTRGKADLDNMIKAVLDGMNGVVYEDDLQVQELRAQVVTGAEEPSTDVVVREWEAENG